MQDVTRARAATGVPVHPDAMIHDGTWPGPRTSHYYFDLNRDCFIQSHPESRGRTAALLRWWPHVVVDLHEMGSNATYFFPPPMDPVNQLVHPTILEWWDIYAAANTAAFDRQGWSFFGREGYDEFYPGYGSSWPIYHGAAGMTYEQASSRGGAVRRRDGTVRALHDATHHHYTTSWVAAAGSTRQGDPRAGRAAGLVVHRRRAGAPAHRSARPVLRSHGLGASLYVPPARLVDPLTRRPNGFRAVRAPRPGVRPGAARVRLRVPTCGRSEPASPGAPARGQRAGLVRPKAFRTGTATFPRGAFVVRVAANGNGVHDWIHREAGAAGARLVPLVSAGVDEGTDLGSNSVFLITPPRVAVVGGTPVSGSSFGYAWYASDQRLAYPITTVGAASLSADLLGEIDGLVVPSVSPGAFERALGDGGWTAIAGWVRGGGTPS